MPSCYKSHKVSKCTLLPTQEIEVHLAKTASSGLELCLRWKKITWVFDLSTFPMG